MSMSQAITASHPNLAEDMKAVTSYSTNRNVWDDTLSLDELQISQSSTFPTVAIITVEAGTFTISAFDVSIAHCNQR